MITNNEFQGFIAVVFGISLFLYILYKELKKKREGKNERFFN